VNIVNTHLGLISRERMAQIKALLSDEWLGRLNGDQPVILCGDFNSVPSSKGYRLLRSSFLDAQVQLKEHRPAGTFYSRLPSFRIDHVFIGPSIQVTGITVPRSELAKVASDHLPLIADLAIPCPGSAFRDDLHAGNGVEPQYTKESMQLEITNPNCIGITIVKDTESMKEPSMSIPNE
jgi:exonuclease III